MKWWETQGKPKRGKCFPVIYETYRKQFHYIRHKCSSEFKDDDETHVPHILRKTHAQWSKRMGVTLDNLCGDTTSKPNIGRYGVGWTDPKIPLEYYLTKEPWEYEQQDKLITERLKSLPLCMGEKQLLETDCVFPHIEGSKLFM